MKKPEGHTLYWIYAWDEKETVYNFETTTNLREAHEMAKGLLVDWRGNPSEFNHGYIFFGNENEAFTYFDPADQFRRRDG